MVEAEDRLPRSLDEGGWLVLSTSPRRVARVGAALRAEPVKPYDPSLLLLDSLREQVTHAGAPVSTVWLLVPWHDAEAVPRLDDAAVPVFGPQWLALREDWLIRRKGRVADGVA